MTKGEAMQRSILKSLVFGMVQVVRCEPKANRFLDTEYHEQSLDKAGRVECTTPVPKNQWDNELS
jgi:hypothetical protein